MVFSALYGQKGDAGGSAYGKLEWGGQVNVNDQQAIHGVRLICMIRVKLEQ